MHQLLAWLATAFPASIVRMRWLVLAVTAALTVWIVPGIAQVQEDNDVLAFLPPDHADVVAFHEIAEAFGVLEIGLVGLGPAEGDMLSSERIADVRELGSALSDRPGVRIVLSYTDLPHPEVKPDGLEVAPLVPTSMTDEAAIRARVLGSKDAVGNFISEDGQAAALLIFLIHESGDDRVAVRAERLRDLRATVEAWSKERSWAGEIHFGGAPFIEDAAARSSRSDIERLSPIVIGVLVLVSGLLLRSLTAAVLNVLVTGLGVALIMGAHGTFGEPLTIVSSSIPVMMVALGGAFGVHILAGYQRQDDARSSQERAAATLRELQVPVLISGLTTSVAFFALYVMPQVPMKRFGVTAGIGVLVLLALAMCVMPALLAVLPKGWIAARRERAMPLRLRPPGWALALLAALGVGLSYALLRADPDTSNVFAENSEPRRANRFFNEHFGGSTYLQVAVEGDIREPVVLRKIRDIVAEVSAIDGVVGVQSVVNPVSVLNEALGGRHGIPETPARSARVFALLDGHPAMAQLMTADATGALIHIKLAPVSGARQVEITQRVRELLARSGEGGALRVAATTLEAVRAQQITDVGATLEVVLGRAVDTDKLLDVFADPSPELLAEVAKVRDTALNSDDSPVDPAHVSPAEIAALDPKRLIKPRGAALEALLRETQPTLAGNDAEGVTFVAEHLGPWVDEVLQKFVVQQRCAVLGLAVDEKKP
ncbi:MAG: MMPL family transporter, partial [Myxococcales bacterium]|nr:MMPL family transporter [Myxococcales bacterium]